MLEQVPFVYFSGNFFATKLTNLAPYRRFPTTIPRKFYFQEFIYLAKK